MGLGVALRGSPKQAGETLTGARDLAHRCREQLRQGVDPIEARDQHREAAREAEAARKSEKARERRTLARCARDYHERVIEPTKTDRHAAQWISSLENHVPAALWDAPIDTITAPALLQALTSIKPHERARNLTEDHRLGETTRRVRQRLEAVFEDAQFHGWCEGNPAAAVRRKMRETMPSKHAGQFAALPYREAPALMQRLQQAQGTAARCLELAVLSAARTGEVIGATWDEMDLDAALWTVPAARMKAKADHVVYLSARAVEVISAQRGQDRTLVFPSPMTLDMPDGERKPLSNMALLTVLDRMGARDRTTVHGLCRATFSTWANETAAGRPDVIEACLAHREADKVRQAYNRAQFADERRALLAAWAEYLARPSAQVIPIAA